ncbi:hypothetical protein F4810DRAFT_117124 [Camillea tinctor]|nr:hypothetical protein F4810DRAFT_117124 [Camillea tinctor]
MENLPPSSISRLEISQPTFNLLLKGVDIAFKLSNKIDKSKVSNVIQSSESFPSLSDWVVAIRTNLEGLEYHVANITIALAVVHEKCRKDGDIPTAGTLPGDALEFVWNLIYVALTTELDGSPLNSFSQSSQGFLCVSLCHLKNGDDIEQLWRLHIWQPGGPRGNPDTPIHSHQAFAQSWILAGKGRDDPYIVEPTSSAAAATHAEYALAWSNDGKNFTTDYVANPKHSRLQRTEKLVTATCPGSAFHTRDMTYAIPAGAYHTSNVEPQDFHATLFFFDAKRGFLKTAGVLGPTDGGPYYMQRDAGANTAASLAREVQSARLAGL